MAKVLVIDDDPAVRRMVVKILSPRHEVIEATNGREGMILFAEHQPALVVTDILMPEKEGIQTIREMRASSPDVRIVAISGGGSEKKMMFLDFAKMLGANAALAKPFRPAELREIVDRLVGDDA